MNTRRIIAIIVLTALILLLLPVFSLAEDYSAMVSEKTVDVYSDSALKNKAFDLARFDIVNVQQIIGDVAAITYRKKSGYCAASALTPVSDMAVEAYVNQKGAYIFSEPNEFSATKAIKKGTFVNKIATSDGWCLIEKNGIGAYIKEEYLTEAANTPTPAPAPSVTPAPTVKATATVKVNKLSVYAKADASSEKLGTLKKGTSVNVLSWDKEWAYIEKNSKYGYCSVRGLAKSDPTPTASVKPTATPKPDDEVIPAKVSVEKVTVYKSASTASKKLGVLKYGTTVNVVKYTKKWAYIEKNGRYGYCKINALTKKKVEPSPTPNYDDDDDYRRKYPNVQFTATVVYEYAPVYDEPTVDGLSIKLPAGMAVDVYAYSKNWAYVGINNKRGFIQKKYLNATEYQELSSGDTGSEVLKLQTELEENGYFDGIPAGTYSTLTTAAVKRFQAEIGLTQTGTADINTLRVLYGGYAPTASLLDNTLKSGDNGAAVERIQTRLYYLGYLSKTDSIDSDYGTTTVSAVKLFEEVAELDIDGVADSVTLKAMYSNDAPQLPSGRNPADYTPGKITPTNPGVTKMPAGLGSTQTTLPENPTAAEKIEYVIYIAQNQLGKPYIYGTAGPNSFDCSGLTCYCFKKINKTLGRSAYAQGYEENTGTKIEGMDNLKRGDIVCFNTIADSDLSDHVGIYIGKGYFIHASSGTSNGKQVVVSQITSGYYQRVFSWGRRPVQ